MKNNLKQLVVAGLTMILALSATCICLGGGEGASLARRGHGRFGAVRPFVHSDGRGQRNDHLREEQPRGLPPASITKVMTMLLIMEAIDEGRMKLTDKVPTSEYAASMGGSQIFLEPGEQMTVDEMLKGIAMASGNDASVAMAEKIAGTEVGISST